MERSLFESFYRGNIEVIAKKIVSDNLDAKKQPKFSYHSNLDGVYEEYLNQKTLLRTVIKNSQLDAEDEDLILLDGHKVSACITCAIIKVRLITSPLICDSEIKGGKAYSLERAFRMNEQVALLSGLSCLYEFMAERPEHLYTNPEDHSKVEPIFPDTFYPTRSTYLDSLVRALYYSNTFSNINPLLLAHIFFHIEAFHRRTVEFKEFRRSVEI